MCRSDKPEIAGARPASPTKSGKIAISLRRPTLIVTPYAMMYAVGESRLRSRLICSRCLPTKVGASLSTAEGRETGGT